MSTGKLFKQELNKQYGNLPSRVTSQASKDRDFYSNLAKEEINKNEENKEQLILRPVKKGITDKVSGKIKMNKPIGKITSMGKKENKEATGSGSSGAYVGPLFGGEPNEFIEKSESETKKVEAKEATTSSSVGAYSQPSIWAKSKKTWGPSKKTQYKGGAFVSIKKKCKNFPYCNQGDINALKLTKSSGLAEAINNVAEKLGIDTNVVINILEHEYKRLQERKK
jgi:hypothetical protein